MILAPTLIPAPCAAPSLTWPFGKVVIDRNAQADRNPKGHDPAEGHGRNDESPVAATGGDAPNPGISGEDE